MNVCESSWSENESQRLLLLVVHHFPVFQFCAVQQLCLEFRFGRQVGRPQPPRNGGLGLVLAVAVVAESVRVHAAGGVSGG